MSLKIHVSVRKLLWNFCCCFNSLCYEEKLSNLGFYIFTFKLLRIMVWTNCIVKAYVTVHSKLSLACVVRGNVGKGEVIAVIWHSQRCKRHKTNKKKPLLLFYELSASKETQTCWTFRGARWTQLKYSVYVSSILLASWRILSTEGKRNSICFTLPEHKVQGS